MSQVSIKLTPRDNVGLPYAPSNNANTILLFQQFFKGAQGIQGIQGKSAYQVWLDAANTGTVFDFLEDLSPLGEYLRLADMPKVKPTLSAKFDTQDYSLYEIPLGKTRKLLSEIFTNTRASSTTYDDPFGKKRSATTNVARICFDQKTNECLGFGTQPTATNLALHTQDMQNGIRQNCDVTVYSGMHPNTLHDAFLLQAVADGVSGWDTGNFSVTNGEKIYAYGVAKEVSANGIGLIAKGLNSSGWQALTVNFDGTIDTSKGADIVVEEQYKRPDGYTYFVVSVMANQTSATCSFQFRVTHNDVNPVAAQNIIVAWLQVTKTPPSSYIPTTTSQGIREADSCTRTLGVEFDRNNFTLVFKSKMVGGNATAAITNCLSIDNGTNFSAGGILFWNWNSSNGRHLYGYSSSGSNVLIASAVTPTYPAQDVFATVVLIVNNGNAYFIIDGVLVNSYTGGDLSIPANPVLNLSGRATTRAQFYKELEVLPLMTLTEGIARSKQP
jgi:hypothetical protein